MNFIKKFLLSVCLVCLSISNAQSFQLIDNYDVYLNDSGPSSGTLASDFLNSSGGSLLHINHFQSNGNSMVIQSATGAGGAVQNNDRFWSVG